MKLARSIVLAAFLYAANAGASETVTDEPDGSSYHFVAHYTIDLKASAPEVWDQLVDLRSWMFEFDLLPEAGTPGQEGEIRRLYSGQDFFIEITKVVPNEVLVFANLPTTFNGEHSTGVAVISLSETEGVTTLSLTMSRRYTWSGEGDNPQRTLRESPEFRGRTRAMWQERFLGRLRSLVESQ